jgi:hypothetical protein
MVVKIPVFVAFGLLHTDFAKEAFMDICVDRIAITYMIFNIAAIESFTWYLAIKYISVIRKNEKMAVAGSGGLLVPVELDGSVLLNGFFLG